MWSIPAQHPKRRPQMIARSARGAQKHRPAAHPHPVRTVCARLVCSPTCHKGELSAKCNGAAKATSWGHSLTNAQDNCCCVVVTTQEGSCCHGQLACRDLTCSPAHPEKDTL